MLRVVIIPRGEASFYRKLADKIKDLRTFYRTGIKKRGQQKWKHTSYDGWLNLEECSSGVAIVVAKARNAEAEWQIVSAFVGALDRHFRDELASVTIGYDVSNKKSRAR